MKHLLCCLLIGSFVFPAWSQEKEMTLDEFIDRVGNAKPWTLEKLESELGIKFEPTSLSEIYSGHTAYGKPPAAKNLPIEGIVLYVPCPARGRGSLKWREENLDLPESGRRQAGTRSTRYSAKNLPWHGMGAQRSTTRGWGPPSAASSPPGSARPSGGAIGLVAQGLSDWLKSDAAPKIAPPQGQHPIEATQA